MPVLLLEKARNLFKVEAADKRPSLPPAVNSPKDVATYDLKPEMSAPEVGMDLVEAIKSDKYDVIVINFANPDMAGHTGVIPAAVKAVERVDAYG